MTDQFTLAQTYLSSNGGTYGISYYTTEVSHFTKSRENANNSNYQMNVFIIMDDYICYYVTLIHTKYNFLRCSTTKSIPNTNKDNV